MEERSSFSAYDYDPPNDMFRNEAGLTAKLRLISERIIVEYATDDTITVREIVHPLNAHRTEHPYFTHSLVTKEGDYVTSFDFFDHSPYFSYARRNGDISLIRYINSFDDTNFTKISSQPIVKLPGDVITQVKHGKMDQGFLAVNYHSPNNPNDATLSILDLVHPAKAIVHYDSVNEIRQAEWSHFSDVLMTVIDNQALRTIDIRAPDAFNAVFKTGGFEKQCLSVLRPVEITCWNGSEVLVFDIRNIDSPIRTMRLPLDPFEELLSMRYNMYLPKQFMIHTTKRKVKVLNVEECPIFIPPGRPTTIFNKKERITFKHLSRGVYTPLAQGARARELKAYNLEIPFYDYNSHYEAYKLDRMLSMPASFTMPYFFDDYDWSKFKTFGELESEYHKFASIGIASVKYPKNDVPILYEAHNVMTFDVLFPGVNGIIYLDETDEYKIKLSPLQYEGSQASDYTVDAVRDTRQVQSREMVPPHLLYQMASRVESGWNAMYTTNPDLFELADLVSQTSRTFWGAWLRNAASMQYSGKEYVNVCNPIGWPKIPQEIPNLDVYPLKKPTNPNGKLELLRMLAPFFQFFFRKSKIRKAKRLKPRVHVDKEGVPISENEMEKMREGKSHEHVKKIVDDHIEVVHNPPEVETSDEQPLNNPFKGHLLLSKYVVGNSKSTSLADVLKKLADHAEKESKRREEMAADEKADAELVASIKPRIKFKHRQKNVKRVKYRYLELGEKCVIPIDSSWNYFLNGLPWKEATKQGLKEKLIKAYKKEKKENKKTKKRERQEVENKTEANIQTEDNAENKVQETKKELKPIISAKQADVKPVVKKVSIGGVQILPPRIQPKTEENDVNKINPIADDADDENESGIENDENQTEDDSNGWIRKKKSLDGNTRQYVLKGLCDILPNVKSRSEIEEEEAEKQREEEKLAEEQRMREEMLKKQQEKMRKIEEEERRREKMTREQLAMAASRSRAINRTLPPGARPPRPGIRELSPDGDMDSEEEEEGEKEVIKLIYASRPRRLKKWDVPRVNEVEMLTLLQKGMSKLLKAKRRFIMKSEYKERTEKLTTSTEEMLLTLKVALTRAQRYGWQTFYDPTFFNSKDFTDVQLLSSLSLLFNNAVERRKCEVIKDKEQKNVEFDVLSKRIFAKPMYSRKTSLTSYIPIDVMTVSKTPSITSESRDGPTPSRDRLRNDTRNDSRIDDHETLNTTLSSRDERFENRSQLDYFDDEVIKKYGRSKSLLDFKSLQIIDSKLSRSLQSLSEVASNISNTVTVAEQVDPNVDADECQIRFVSKTGKTYDETSLKRKSSKISKISNGKFGIGPKEKVWINRRRRVERKESDEFIRMIRDFLPELKTTPEVCDLSRMQIEFVEIDKAGQKFAIAAPALTNKLSPQQLRVASELWATEGRTMVARNPDRVAAVFRFRKWASPMIRDINPVTKRSVWKKIVPVLRTKRNKQQVVNGTDSLYFEGEDYDHKSPESSGTERENDDDDENDVEYVKNRELQTSKVKRYRLPPPRKPRKEYVKKSGRRKFGSTQSDRKTVVLPKCFRSKKESLSHLLSFPNGFGVVSGGTARSLKVEVERNSNRQSSMIKDVNYDFCDASHMPYNIFKIVYNQYIGKVSRNRSIRPTPVREYYSKRPMTVASERPHRPQLFSPRRYRKLSESSIIPARTRFVLRKNSVQLFPTWKHPPRCELCFDESWPTRYICLACDETLPQSKPCTIITRTSDKCKRRIDDENEVMTCNENLYLMKCARYETFVCAENAALDRHTEADRVSQQLKHEYLQMWNKQYGNKGKNREMLRAKNFANDENPIKGQELEGDELLVTTQIDKDFVGKQSAILHNFMKGEVRESVDHHHLAENEIELDEEDFEDVRAKDGQFLEEKMQVLVQVQQAQAAKHEKELLTVIDKHTGERVKKWVTSKVRAEKEERKRLRKEKRIEEEQEVQKKLEEAEKLKKAAELKAKERLEQREKAKEKQQVPPTAVKENTNVVGTSLTRRLSTKQAARKVPVCRKKPIKFDKRPLTLAQRRAINERTTIIRKNVILQQMWKLRAIFEGRKCIAHDKHLYRMRVKLPPMVWKRLIFNLFLTWLQLRGKKLAKLWIMKNEAQVTEQFGSFADELKSRMKLKSSKKAKYHISWKDKSQRDGIIREDEECNAPDKEKEVWIRKTLMKLLAERKQKIEEVGLKDNKEKIGEFLIQAEKWLRIYLKGREAALLNKENDDEPKLKGILKKKTIVETEESGPKNEFKNLGGSEQRVTPKIGLWKRSGSTTYHLGRFSIKNHVKNNNTRQFARVVVMVDGEKQIVRLPMSLKLKLDQKLRRMEDARKAKAEKCNDGLVKETDRKKIKFLLVSLPRRKRRSKNKKKRRKQKERRRRKVMKRRRRERKLVQQKEEQPAQKQEQKPDQKQDQKQVPKPDQKQVETKKKVPRRGLFAFPNVDKQTLKQLRKLARKKRKERRKKRRDKPEIGVEATTEVDPDTDFNERKTAFQSVKLKFAPFLRPLSTFVSRTLSGLTVNEPSTSSRPLVRRNTAATIVPERPASTIPATTKHINVNPMGSKSQGSSAEDIIALMKEESLFKLKEGGLAGGLVLGPYTSGEGCSGNADQQQDDNQDAESIAKPILKYSVYLLGYLIILRKKYPSQFKHVLKKAKRERYMNPGENDVDEPIFIENKTIRCQLKVQQLEDSIKNLENKVTPRILFAQLEIKRLLRKIKKHQENAPEKLLAFDPVFWEDFSYLAGTTIDNDNAFNRRRPPLRLSMNKLIRRQRSKRLMKFRKLNVKKRLHPSKRRKNEVNERLKSLSKMSEKALHLNQKKRPLQYNMLSLKIQKKKRELAQRITAIAGKRDKSVKICVPDDELTNPCDNEESEAEAETKKLAYRRFENRKFIDIAEVLRKNHMEPPIAFDKYEIVTRKLRAKYEAKVQAIRSSMNMMKRRAVPTKSEATFLPNSLIDKDDRYYDSDVETLSEIHSHTTDDNYAEPDDEPTIEEIAEASFWQQRSENSTFNVKGLPGLLCLAHLVEQRVGEHKGSYIKFIGPIFERFNVKIKNTPIRRLMLLACGLKQSSEYDRSDVVFETTDRLNDWFSTIFQSMCYGRGGIFARLLARAYRLVGTPDEPYEALNPPNQVWAFVKLYKKLISISSGKEDESVAGMVLVVVEDEMERIEAKKRAEELKQRFAATQQALKKLPAELREETTDDDDEDDDDDAADHGVYGSLTEEVDIKKFERYEDENEYKLGDNHAIREGAESNYTMDSEQRFGEDEAEKPEERKEKGSKDNDSAQGEKPKSEEDVVSERLTKHLQRIEQKKKAERLWAEEEWFEAVDMFIEYAMQVPHASHEVIACVLFLRMIYAGGEPEDIVDDIIHLKIPIQDKLLFIINICPYDQVYIAMRKLYQTCRGLDRLPFVGLGYHKNSLQILHEEAVLIGDCQLITHLLIIGKCLDRESEPEQWPDDANSSEVKNRDVGAVFDLLLNIHQRKIKGPKTMFDAFPINYTPKTGSELENLSCEELAIRLECEVSKYTAVLELLKGDYYSDDIMNRSDRWERLPNNMQFEVACKECHTPVMKSKELAELGKEITVRTLPLPLQIRRDALMVTSKNRKLEELQEEELTPFVIATQNEVKNEQEVEELMAEMACQKCKAGYPRCIICKNKYLTPKMLKSRTAGEEVDAMAALCLLCGHGGHVGHIIDWFSTEQVCAAHECTCQCMTIADLVMTKEQVHDKMLHCSNMRVRAHICDPKCVCSSSSEDDE